MTKTGAWSSRKEDFAKKLVGIVTVVTGKENAQFTLTEDGKKFSNGTTKIKIPLKDLPTTPRLKQDDKSGKEYRIRMNSDGDKVEALMPVRGHFMAKLVDLGKRPDAGKGDPMPFEKVFNEGKDNEERHLEFFAVYEITEGAFKGVKLPAYQMHYKFEENPENEGFTRFSFNPDNPKATRGHQLVDWMKVHGLLDEEVPWDDETILPVLLERALENDVTVEVNLKDGYILREGGVVPSEYEGEFDGEESEEESVDEDDEQVEKDFPKQEEKKSAKPAAKKIAKGKKTQEEDDDL